MKYTDSNMIIIRRFSAIVFYVPMHKFWEKWIWKF